MDLASVPIKGNRILDDFLGRTFQLSDACASYQRAIKTGAAMPQLNNHLW